jgi:hypothetical protein
MNNKEKILRRNFLEKYEANRRAIKDRRKRIAWAVFSYLDENNVEYRKAFEAPAGTPENDFWDIAPKFLNYYKI